LHFFPPLEVDMSAYPVEEAGIYTSRIKVELADQFYYHCPAPLLEEQVEALNWLAAATFRVMDCRDVARIDFRLDANDNNKPYILEINPLPGLNPGYSDLCVEAQADGWSYDRLINRILEAAIERHQLNHKYNPSIDMPLAETLVTAL
jgi:D-alanine-D-alanine ligase